MADIIATIIKILVVIGAIMLSVPMLVWLERKLVADFQVRIGPNRVGPFGLLQSFADGIKLIFKEDIIPTNADRALYLLAPVVIMLPALAMIAVIPFGPAVDVGGRSHPLQISVGRHLNGVPFDIPVGVLYILAISSLGVYGIVLAGWSSNNKYALLGGLRASAQMISYEIALGMSTVAVLLLAGNVTLSQVIAQQQLAHAWFIIPLTVAFVIFFISALAETNRLPFDLPEAEGELIAGYHTEYSAMKFSMFYIAEYSNM